GGHRRPPGAAHHGTGRDAARRGRGALWTDQRPGRAVRGPPGGASRPAPDRAAPARRRGAADRPAVSTFAHPRWRAPPPAAARRAYRRGAGWRRLLCRGDRRVAGARGGLTSPPRPSPAGRGELTTTASPFGVRGVSPRRGGGCRRRVRAWGAGRRGRLG